MNVTKTKPKAKNGRNRRTVHQRIIEDSSHMKEISSTSNGPLSSFYSTGPILSLKSLVQPKLIIGKPNDRYEREADQVADQVISTPEAEEPLANVNSSLVQQKFTYPGYIKEKGAPIRTKSIADHIMPLVQREVVPEEDEEKKESEEAAQGKFIQKQEEEKKKEETVNLRTETNTGSSPKVTPTVASGIRSLKGGGQPLPKSVRNYFESRFNHDLSQVRVHTDSKAAETAKSINAKAFTNGKDIVFSSGQYSPGTLTGRRLIAHELTHILQNDNSIRRHANTDEKKFEAKIKQVKIQAAAITGDNITFANKNLLKCLYFLLCYSLRNFFIECNDDYTYLYNKKLIIEKELEKRRVEAEREKLRQERKPYKKLVEHITKDNIMFEDFGDLVYFSSQLDYCMENYFIEYNDDYVYLQDKKIIIDEEIEKRKAEEIFRNFKAELSIMRYEWKAILKEELLEKYKFPDVQDWVLNAIGYLKGLPYLSAHKLYGVSNWRRRYREGIKKGGMSVFPAAVVCDQLGEITQQLARGMYAYGIGPQGLTGHYLFYQEKDSSFHKPPEFGHSRLAPGATIFIVGEPDSDFSEEAEKHFDKRRWKRWSWLYSSGLPKKGVSWEELYSLRRIAYDIGELKRTIGAKKFKTFFSKIIRKRRRFPEWQKELINLKKSYKPGEIETFISKLIELEEDKKEKLIAELKKVFVLNKRIRHEATLIAVAHNKKNPKNPNLLFLDTYTREEGRLIKGTSQIRPSTLAREKSRHWGYVDAGITSKIIPKIPEGFNVWVEFYGETQMPKYLLRFLKLEKPPRLLRLLSMEEGKPRWKKPAWMTKL